MSHVYREVFAVLDAQMVESLGEENLVVDCPWKHLDLWILGGEVLGKALCRVIVRQETDTSGILTWDDYGNVPMAVKATYGAPEEVPALAGWNGA